MTAQNQNINHKDSEFSADDLAGKPEYISESPENRTTDSFIQSPSQHEGYVYRQVSINYSEGKPDTHPEQHLLSNVSTPAPKPLGNDIFSLSFCYSSEDDQWHIDNRSSIFRLENSVLKQPTGAMKTKGLKTSFDLLGDDLAPNDSLVQNTQASGLTDNRCHENPSMKLARCALREKEQPLLETVISKKKVCYSDMVTTLLPKERAFSEFTFRVSPLKEAKHLIANSFDSKSYERNYDPYYKNQENILIAKRRLKSAVLAFGGNFGSITDTVGENDGASRDSKKPKLDVYEETLSSRYYENCGRLSWDVEESAFEDRKFCLGVTDSHSDFNYDASEYASNLETTNGSDDNGFLYGNDSSESSSTSEEEDCCKTKYRCKLCGKPKQNHECSYQQALERSIGTMVYPSLNAFECEEPGRLAPVLSDMNNFTDLIDVAEENADRKLQSMDVGSGREAITSVKKQTKFDWKRSDTDGENCVLNVGSKRKLFTSSDTKSDFVRNELFLKKTPIRIEQYKTVTDISHKNETVTERNFRYPTVPLTMAHRTSMSKFLFDLCQQVDGLTEICTEVLSKAGETESWDLVVAELITQSLVIIHCPPEDQKLDGLRNYLLTIGIST